MRDPIIVMWERILHIQQGNFRGRKYAAATYGVLIGFLVGYIAGSM